MIAKMRGACLVGVLVIVIGCLTETRAYVSFDQVNPGNSSVSDDDLLKSAVSEQEAKAGTEKPKVTRVQLEPRNRRAIDGSLATINENDGGKPSRISIKERPVTEEVAPKTRPGAKRNHKKMKLAQTQKKSKKTKRYIDTAARQQLFGNQNHSETERVSPYRSKYHAQRKFIMDRFHARNREIFQKYQRRTSTTTTTTTTEGPVKYDLLFGRSSTETRDDRFIEKAKVKPPIATPSPRIPARTSPSSRSILETDYSDEMNESSDELTTTKRTRTERKKPSSTIPETTTTSTERKKPSSTIPETSTTTRAPPSDGRIQKVGECDNLEILDELYQHNLVLDSQRSTMVEAQILSPTVEGSCVTCVIAQQTSGPPQDINVSKSSKTVNIRVQGIEDGSVAIAVKFYTKNGDC